MRNVPYEIKKIINVANELLSHGTTGASTSEAIAAAFVLDRMAFLPQGYSVIEAWERLDHWQALVKKIKAECSPFLVAVAALAGVLLHTRTQRLKKKGRPGIFTLSE